MDVRTLAGLLRARSLLRSHDRWTRDELRVHQTDALAYLRAFAVERSPFYRTLHRGLGNATLDQLPVVTKAMLMEQFDEVVTDRAVRLADVESYLHSAGAADRFRDHYRVAATAGTTGRRGIFLADPAEWTTILASYARANDWAELPAGLTHRLRIAMVSSRNPSHQSSIVGATLASRFVPTLRLDATDPLDEIVGSLNQFRPESLVGYASMLSLLAEEQAAGRLRITPRAVMSASEVLTQVARARIRAAFAAEPFNVYAATETAGIASECEYHRLHLYEDLVITEIVDEDNRPVRPGDFGAKLLVSVLFSRTQPLIRYEISDRVQASIDMCADGRPFSLLGGIEGREEDVLHLPGPDGRPVLVHPNVFHTPLEPLPVSAWQVVQQPDGIEILLAGAGEGIDELAVSQSIREALSAAGVGHQAIRIERVESITRTPLGKAPLVRALS